MKDIHFNLLRRRGESMSKPRVNNKARFAGKVIHIRKENNFTSMIINTGPEEGSLHHNTPRVVAFEKVLPFLSNIEVGDYVLVDATIQSNRGNPATPRTFAVNHVSKLNPDTENYKSVNRFNLNGKLLNPEKIGKNIIKARVLVRGNQTNFLTVHLYSQNTDEIERLMSAEGKLVFLTGTVETDKDFDKDGTIRRYERLSIKRFNVFE